MVFNLLWVFENLVKILAVVIGSDDKAAAVGPEKYFSKSLTGVSFIAILVIRFFVILNNNWHSFHIVKVLCFCNRFWIL